MNSFQISGDFAIYFSKEILCVGEPAKIVVSKLRPVGDYKLVAKLETVEGPLPAPPEILVLEQQHADFINIATDDLKPGPYLIKIYFAPPMYQTQEEVPERYAIAEYALTVLAFDQYEHCFQELFGEEWDDAVYPDSQDWKQLSSFFVTFNAPTIGANDFRNAKNVRANPLSEGGDGEYSFVSESWEETFEGCLLSRILQVLDDAMQFESRRPFHFRYTAGFSGLPHVNLTKYVWLLNVLGSTWTDMFFFSTAVELDIKASVKSIEMRMSSRANNAVRESQQPSWLIPSDEPPLFLVVRNTIQAGLNCELSYDAHSGVTLMVNSNQSFLSMSARVE